MSISKNTVLLESFRAYCEHHPELRFWQALRSWSGHNFIYVSSQLLEVPALFARDTYYWETKDGKP